ncbi:unnamed protein product [Meloidogyne enterolobii]|uniref:Uncharacterized protein n=1 Tax=Meloidogyne enterolobii TaxID=390850 RepID=A0ACB0YRX7_MELEN
MQSKLQHKKLPNEMLVDIFKASERVILEEILSKFDRNNGPSMVEHKKFEKMWSNQVLVYLTCSSIIPTFVGKEFQKRWLSILKERESVRLYEVYWIGQTPFFPLKFSSYIFEKWSDFFLHPKNGK